MAMIPKHFGSYPADTRSGSALILKFGFESGVTFGWQFSLAEFALSGCLLSLFSCFPLSIPLACYLTIWAAPMGPYWDPLTTTIYLQKCVEDIVLHMW